MHESSPRTTTEGKLLLSCFIYLQHNRNGVNYDLKSVSITYLKISLSQSLYPSN
ncbi:hypothetical protein OIU79_012198 [Salix purpurea]|uniref:Uncharacterized protein n=1 Tax=Salix purpurea TaxID=77065 RepID=A0A9Q0Q384_SALPP|nr:hypothetical protein OIU79_012198 [Salix purpurea]